MSVAGADRRVAWEQPTGAFGAPVALQAWAGERVDLEVEADTVALVHVGHDLRAAFLTGSHVVHVLRHGEEAGDLTPRELAARLRVDLDDVAAIRARTLHVPATARVHYVAAGADLFLEIGRQGPVSFRDRVHGDVPLTIEGVARLAVIDPVAFHRSFLAGSEDLTTRDLERILTAVLEAGVAPALEAEGADFEAIDADPTVVAAQLVSRLAPQFAPLGLGCEDLEITRLERPTPSPAPTVAPTLATPEAGR